MSWNDVVVDRLAAVGIAIVAAMMFFGQPAKADAPIESASHAKIPASEFVGYSCEELWFMRNSIFNDRGYCFKTAKAQATFDNADCVSSDPGILNSFERHNVSVIKSVEHQRGCR